MAIPVARVHLATAHAALPALLPTPPKSNILPRLATACVLILPMSPPKLCSRADVVRKSPSPWKPGRADAAERWDAHKIKPSSPASSPCSSQRSSSDSTFGRACSDERWDAKKKSSSSERWDTHKKPCPPQSTGKSNDMVLGNGHATPSFMVRVA